jgi:predicted ATPase
LGHFDSSDQLLALALEKAQSSFDKANIYVIKIFQLAGQGKYQESVAIAIEALNMFGMNVPTLDQTEAQQKATESEMVLYQANMKNRQIEDLYHLPLMQDKVMKACSQIIAKAIISIIIGLPHLLAFYAIKMVNISIQYGLSPFTPVVYSFFAIIRSGGFKDYDGAYQFAALALRLNQNKLFDYSAKPTIYNNYGFFNLLKEHINSSVEYFRETYRVALEGGDFSTAVYPMIEIPRYLIPISIAEGLKATQDTITYCQKANNLPILQVAQMNECFLQNLLGHTLNQTSFNIGDFREEEFLKAVETAAPLTCAVYKRYKLQSLSLFGDYEAALSLVHERATWINAFGRLDFNLGSDYYLHAGITCAALYPNANEADKQTYLDILEECLAENQLLA